MRRGDWDELRRGWRITIGPTIQGLHVPSYGRNVYLGWTLSMLLGLVQDLPNVIGRRPASNLCDPSGDAQARENELLPPGPRTRIDGYDFPNEDNTKVISSSPSATRAALRAPTTGLRGDELRWATATPTSHRHGERAWECAGMRLHAHRGGIEAPW